MALTGRRILLGVSGGIAAYKAADLARRLSGEGAEVTAVLTTAACRFVTPLTFRTLTGRPVATELFSDPGSPVPHVSLARWAELVLVAPATADRIARAACGRADDLLAAVLLDTDAPVLWAPAMNTRMWRHPLTREHVERLKSLGHSVVAPETGELACGEQGEGRLASVDRIMDAVRECLSPAGPLAGKRVLITAGPTREPWDAIRFLSNRSTGKMGYALAAEARRRGAQVTLVSGPVALEPPDGVKVVSVTTAQDMYEACLAAYPEQDIVIAAAAVADVRPAERHADKLKKTSLPGQLALAPNPDILLEMGRRKHRQLLVGFAAETGDLESGARAKLVSKNLDLVVANAAAGPEDAFAADRSAAVLLDAQDGRQVLDRRDKSELASAVLDRIQSVLAARA